jgi:glycine/D-amino acid oxidase-like deaminating enzyme
LIIRSLLCHDHTPWTRKCPGTADTGGPAARQDRAGRGPGGDPGAFLKEGVELKDSSADVVICGAGMAGISAAYHLAVRRGVGNVLLVDALPPFTLTSDKSTEAYRNWWPGPGDTMVRFMNRSIDLLEELVRESDNLFHMNRRGYTFFTADPGQVPVMERSAREISEIGAGPLRCHRGRSDDSPYAPSHPRLTGADLVLDPALIRKHYPFISERAVAMLHTRRCGWMSAQQLGMYLLEQAKGRGVRFVRGRVAGVTVRGGRVESVHLGREDGPAEISTPNFVIAAGPLLKEVGAMVGVDFPVFNELHGKIAFEDGRGVVPRDAPLMIWNDPVGLPWTGEEREELASREETRWLLEELPGGVHFRPEGGPGSHTLLALWTYHIEPREPVWPLDFPSEYGEVLVRGLSRMIPGLEVYLEKMPKPVVDGGYYCKTRENRPLIGPLPVDGAYVIGAMSGFGIMGGMAAGELLAAHATGGELPAYAPDFLLSRYEDPEYRKLLSNWDAESGQL